MGPLPLGIAICTLAPALLGPAPASAEPAGLSAHICGAGIGALPLQQQPTVPASQPCCAKGCQPRRERRRKFDRAQ